MVEEEWQELTCVEVGAVTTHTGRYPYSECGLTPTPLNAGEPGVDVGRVGLWMSDAEPTWWAIDIGAYPHDIINDRDDPQVNNRFVESEHMVSVNGSDAVLVRVAPGSIKSLDNGSPVEITQQRIRDAVDARLLPKIDTDAVFASRGFSVKWMTEKEWGQARHGYKPEKLFQPGNTAGSAVLDLVGGQGGEGLQGRTHLSEFDAEMIRLALSTSSSARDKFEKFKPWYMTQARYSRAMPFQIIQSRETGKLRDPQFPDAGEPQYSNTGFEYGIQVFAKPEWIKPEDYEYFDWVPAGRNANTNHTRDLGHAFSYGDVWYGATGDPRAAMLLQSRVAWALSWPFWTQTRSTYDVALGFNGERETLNMWRDAVLLPEVLNRSMSVEGDTPLWNNTKLNRVATEVAEKLQKWNTKPDNPMTEQFHSVDAYEGMAHFMTHKYGLATAYRLAEAGYPWLLEKIAKQWIIRFGMIGGRSGYDPDRGTGNSLIRFPPGAWTIDEAIAWWEANSEDFDQRDNWRGEEESLIALTQSGFDMMLDAAERGWITAPDGLAEAAEKSALIAEPSGTWPHYNRVRFAVAPWQ